MHSSRVLEQMARKLRSSLTAREIIELPLPAKLPKEITPVEDLARFAWAVFFYRDWIKEYSDTINDKYDRSCISDLYVYKDRGGNNKVISGVLQKALYRSHLLRMLKDIEKNNKDDPFVRVMMAFYYSSFLYSVFKKYVVGGMTPQEAKRCFCWFFFREAWLRKITIEENLHWVRASKNLEKPFVFS